MEAHFVSSDDGTRESSNIDEKNILLLGSTGIGKSSFCNFLFNGTDQGPFKTSSNRDPCTKELNYATLDWDTVRINIIDSPGLNEPDFKDDIINLQLFLKTLQSKFRCLHMIIFVCLEDSRDDNQTVKTFQYYKSVFTGLLMGFNAVFIGTKCTQDRWEEYAENNGEIYLEKIKEFRNSMKKYLDLNPSQIYFTNVKYPPSKKDKIPREYEAAKKSNNQSAIMGSVFLHSLQARDIILQNARSLRGRPLTEIHVQLPPTAYLVFKNVLTTLKLRQQEFINKESDPHKKQELLQLYTHLATSVQLKGTLIRDLIELSNDIHKLAHTCDSAELSIFNFKILLNLDYPIQFKINSQYLNHERLRWECNNCSIISCDENECTGEIFATIRLNWMKAFKAECYAVMNGKIFNKVKYTQTEVELKKVIENIQKLMDQMENLKKADILQKGNAFLAQYDKDLFTLQEFDSVLDVLKRNKIDEKNPEIDLNLL
jgi:hypothetical protein